MDIAFKLLKRGILTVDEYRQFFDEMSQKYDSEDIRIMYQNKLDIYIEQNANGKEGY